MPEELFQPYTHAKTVVVVIEKTKPTKKPHNIFMGIARWCGHDSRGHEIPHDDIPKIRKKYQSYQKNNKIKYDHWGFAIKSSEIKDNIYLPKYYNPEIPQKLKKLEKTHELLRFGDLVDNGTLTVTTGHEVGKLAYGSGKIPFVRTSEIANWEIKLDPKHGLSEDIYESLREKQDVQQNDILMVRDGTYLVGSCAIVTAKETRIVFQSHIYKIRSQDDERLHPYLLLAILSSPIVKEQIFSKRFTQDIIDTLGSRIHELILPVPKDEKAKEKIVKNVSKVLEHKDSARHITKDTVLDVAPTTIDGDEEGLDTFLTMTK